MVDALDFSAKGDLRNKDYLRALLFNWMSELKRHKLSEKLLLWLDKRRSTNARDLVWQRLLIPSSCSHFPMINDWRLSRYAVADHHLRCTSFQNRLECHRLRESWTCACMLTKGSSIHQECIRKDSRHVASETSLASKFLHEDRPKIFNCAVWTTFSTTRQRKKTEKPFSLW